MSNNTTARRIAQGIAALASGQLINFANKFLLTPILLKYWGVDLYAYWLALTAAVSYLAFSSFGAQLYVTNRLNQLYSSDQQSEFVAVLNNSLGFFLLFCLGFFALSALFIFTLPLGSWLKLTEEPLLITKILLTIIAFQLVFSVIQGLLTNVYQAMGQLSLGVNLINTISLLQLAFSILILVTNANIILFALAQILPMLLINGFIIFNLKRKFADFRWLGLRELDFKLLSSFIKPSGNFLLIEVSFVLTIQSITSLINILLNPLSVVIFNTLRTIINSVRQALGILSHSAWPEMTRLAHQNEDAALTAVLLFTLRSSLTAASLIGIALVLFGQPLYEFWLHHAVPYNKNIMELFLLYAYQQTFWMVFANLLMASNKHRLLAKLYLINALSTLILAYFLGQHYGLIGVTISLMACELLICFWSVPLIAKYEFPSLPLGAFCLEALVPFILLIFAMVLPKFGFVSLALLLAWTSVFTYQFYLKKQTSYL